MKTCTKCGEIKPLDAFGVDNSKPDRLSIYCRPCKNSKVAAWRRENPERTRELGRKSDAKRYADPAKRAAILARNTARLAEWRKTPAGKAATAEYGKRSYRKHRKAKADWQRRYAHDRRWDPATRAHVLALDIAQRNRRRAAAQAVGSEPYDVAELFARWGGKCCYCDELAAEVEHVTPLCRGGVDAPSNVVPSCVGCNRGVGGKHKMTLAEWAMTF
jgi:5-methylcytosine-specific restriction endonuclease McrA